MRRSGFTKASNVVLFDARLSLQARACHSMLLHAAWARRPERVEGDIVGQPVALPATPELAEELGIPEASFRRYLNELRKHGYIETKRENRRAPMVYRIFASPIAEEQTRGPESARRRAVPYARASERGELKPKTVGSNDPTPGSVWEDAGEPPKLTRVEGQSPAFDALAEATGTSPDGPRAAELAVALNGNPRSLATHPGINRLFWLDIAERYGLTLVEVRARAATAADRYHEALAAAIHHRAADYTRKMPPGTMLTPTALAKWWRDLDRMQAPGGLSGDDIRRLGDAGLAS